MTDELPLYPASALWQPRAMKVHRTISLDPAVADIADKMNRDFQYNNFSKLIEDLIRSAAEATEIILIPATKDRPARRLFVVREPKNK